MRVLVAEEHERLAAFVAVGLRRSGLSVDPFVATVKATVNRLRAALGDLPIIETVRDRGYRIGGQ